MIIVSNWSPTQDELLRTIKGNHSMMLPFFQYLSRGHQLLPMKRKSVGNYYCSSLMEVKECFILILGLYEYLKAHGVFKRRK